MNLKNLLVVFLTVFALSSCSKDDTGNNTDASIVGTWEQTSGVTISKLKGVEVRREQSDSEDYQRLVFEKDGTVDFFSFDSDTKKWIEEDLSAAYTVSGNKLTIKVQGVTGEATFKISNNVLEVTSTETYKGDSVDEYVTIDTFKKIK